MHVQIINFNLNNAAEEEYLAICEGLAPIFSAMPGLLTKYWLADRASNTYGGVYIWKDRAAMESFMAGEVAAAVMVHPSLANITSRDFGILDAPTRVTHGLLPATAS
jgi:hypothetical protein